MEVSKKNKYQAINELNKKYNVYKFEITCYEEAYEFYEALANTYDLDIPAVIIDESDVEKALFIIDNWRSIR